MAWIESHQNLREHPKTIGLCAAMMWDIDTAIGKLHRFWWWSLDYATDGDLRKFNDFQIAAAAGVAITDSRKFTKAMCTCGSVGVLTLSEPGQLTLPSSTGVLTHANGGLAQKTSEVVSGFIDREPYFRIHDWWDYAGRFLQVRWKHNPEKWQAVRAAYKGAQIAQVEPLAKQPPREPPLEQQTNQPYQPYQPTTPTARAREPKRLHGIPASVDEVIAYGAACRPKPVSEAVCRAFWSYYEGQARTNPNGDVFWITSREAVVTNWKVKLPEFGIGKGEHGSNRKDTRKGADRNSGTLNNPNRYRQENLKQCSAFQGPNEVQKPEPSAPPTA